MALLDAADEMDLSMNGSDFPTSNPNAATSTVVPSHTARTVRVAQLGRVKSRVGQSSHPFEVFEPFEETFSTHSSKSDFLSVVLSRGQIGCASIG